jgi:single-strand DNA-binding protein
MGWHQTIVVGNLGRDPELSQLPSGSTVCNFTMAVSENWNDRQTGEKREKTTWYRVSVFGQQADAVNQYLSKGREVLVIGTVEARAYMNNNGEAAASLELRAQRVQFLSGRDGGSGMGGNFDEPSGRRGGDDYDSHPPASTDDIPF